MPDLREYSADPPVEVIWVDAPSGPTTPYTTPEDSTRRGRHGGNSSSTFHCASGTSQHIRLGVTVMDIAAQKVDVPERLVAAFLGIIQLDCLAIDHARSTMAAEIARGSDFDAALIWSSINTILSRAAGLSKCFWPPMMGIKAEDKPLVVARGEELCDMFQMTDTSPLHDRAVRNSVEHIDQRLHVWMAEIRPDSRIVDLIVGPEDVLNEDELKGQYVFRRFDYQNGVIHVGTDILPILPLFEESNRLYNLIPAFTSEPTAGEDWKYIPPA